MLFRSTIRAIDKQLQAERRASSQLQTQQNTAAERAAAQLISQENERQLKLASAQTALERDRLSLTRSGLAARQGDIELLRISNELDKKNIELAAAKNQAGKVRKQQLEQEVQLLQQQKQQAEAVRQNALTEAQRQITKDLNSLEVQKLGVSNEINQLAIQRVGLQRGELAGLQATDKNLENELNTRAQALTLQRDSALIGVNEASVRAEINELYKGQLQQLVIEIGNRKLANQQQQAAYNLGQLQIKQQRELNNLQTKSQFTMQLKTLQMQQDMIFEIGRAHV